MMGKNKVNCFEKWLIVHDGNKDSRKFIRSKLEIYSDQQEQIERKKFLIHPYSKFRHRWDIFMTIFLALTLIVIPVSVAFYRGDTRSTWIAWNLCIDLIFIFDMLANFFSGYTDELTGKTVMDLKTIRIQYLKSWFIVDALSSFPIDFIALAIEASGYSIATSTFKILEMVKLLSLFRMLRIFRLFRYIRKLQKFVRLGRATIRMFNIIMAMFLICHWNACFQFLVVNLQNFPSNSWVVRSGYLGKPVFDQYSVALFRAISHMTSCGYGLGNPESLTDIWLMIFSIGLGCTEYGLFIASLTFLVESINASGRTYDEKVNEIEEYLRYHHLPKDIRQKVLCHYDRKFHGKFFNEAKMLSVLSPVLKKEILRHTRRGLLQNVPFFSDLEVNILDEILHKLHQEVFLEGDCIFEAGDYGNCMYFIECGSIEVTSKDNQGGSENKILNDGDYFGASCLISNIKRPITAIALEDCDVYRLDKINFQEIDKLYPEHFESLKEEAKRMVSTDTDLDFGHVPNSISGRPICAWASIDYIPRKKRASWSDIFHF